MNTPRGATMTVRPPGEGPVFHPQLSERIRSRLEEAVPVALQHLRRHRSCRWLFSRLGADAVAMLKATTYRPAGTRQERRYCRRGVRALTAVRSSTVAVCRSFARLTDREAAVILLHEALHFAGQTEYPSDRGAPDDLDITRMVMESCQLSCGRLATH